MSDEQNTNSQPPELLSDESTNPDEIASEAFSEVVGASESDDLDGAQGTPEIEASEAAPASESEPEQLQGDDNADSGPQPVELSEADLSQEVRLPDGSVRTLAELSEAANITTNAQQVLEREMAVTQHIQDLESQKERLGKYAETLAVPHEHIGEYLREQVAKGAIPESLFREIDRVFTEANDRGEYNANQITLDAQQRAFEQRQLTQQQQFTQKEAELEALSQLAEIESTHGTKLTQDQKSKMADVINQQAAAGFIVGPKQAFDHLLKMGKIDMIPQAAPTAKALAEKLRVGASTIQKPTQNSPSSKDIDSLGSEAFAELMG